MREKGEMERDSHGISRIPCVLRPRPGRKALDGVQPLVNSRGECNPRGNLRETDRFT
jgi:hypothetical protein